MLKIYDAVAVHHVPNTKDPSYEWNVENMRTVCTRQGNDGKMMLRRVLKVILSTWSFSI